MLSEEKRIRSKEDFRRYIELECKRYGVSPKGSCFAIRENEILAKHNIVLRKGSPFYFGVKNAETLAITGFESVLNMKHAKMLIMLLKT